MKFAFADGTEELYEGGDAYYAPPGHLPTLYAGTEVVEFSPTAELQKTLEVVSKNMEAGVPDKSFAAWWVPGGCSTSVTPKSTRK